ncbi:MAG: metal ABC transporter permease [Candidatus Anstonellales archaeon]
MDFSILAYGFVQRALLVSIPIAITLGILGVFVVMRRMAFVVDAIAHISIAGIALSLLLSIPYTIGALIAGAFGASMLPYLRRLLGVSEDSAAGILFPTGLSAGIMLLIIAGATGVDIISYLFGSLFTLSFWDVLFAYACAALVALFFFSKKKEMMLVAVNPEIAKTEGISPERLDALMLLVFALGIVSALKAAGIILVSALVMLPPVAAMQLRKGLNWSIALSIAISFLSFIAGIALSFFIDMPSGVGITVAASILLGLSLAYGVIQR